MSGKAPPRGPRALLGSLPPSGPAAQTQNQQPQQSSGRQPAGSGTGTVPPTGPRSLMNGLASRQPVVSVVGKAVVNGYGHAHGFVRVPPSGPKGKGVDPHWASGRPPPAGPSALLSQRATNKSASASTSPSSPWPPARPFSPPPPKHSPPPPPGHRSDHHRPPSPSGSPPPPPPPPRDEQPPPPPPDTPPPPPPPGIPHLFAPIKLRLAQPQEPRLAPPPLPPSSPEPPEPAVPKPPTFAPPPLPPPDPRQPPPPPPTAVPPPPPLPVSKSLPPPKIAPPRPASPPIPDGVVVCKVLVNGKPEKRYSLAPPPAWPPLRSEFAPGRDFRVLFDSACDKDRNGEAKALIETLRAAGPAAAERIKENVKDKGKGKPPLVYRYDGETVEGEDEPRSSDPRKADGFKKAKVRYEYHCALYEHDANSPGPPPPTNVLVFDFPPLTTSAAVRRHFQKHGSIVSFEREIDRATGAQLGVVSIKYSTHEEAKRCVTAEEGKNFAASTIGLGISTASLTLAGGQGAGVDAHGTRVVFDGEGKLLKLVLAFNDERRKREKERKRLQAQVQEAGSSTGASVNGTPGSGKVSTPANGQLATSVPNQIQGQPPSSMMWRSRPHPNAPHVVPPHQPHQHPLPVNPFTRAPPTLPDRPNTVQSAPYYARVNAGPNQRRAPPASLLRARAMNSVKSTVPLGVSSPAHGLLPPEADLGSGAGAGRSPGSHASTPMHPHGSAFRGPRDRMRGRGHAPYVPLHSHSHRPLYSHPHTPTQTSSSTPRGSRSPSPVARRPGAARAGAEREAAHAAVVRELTRNGFEHARIDEAQLSSGAAREGDVRDFFTGFPIDKVLHDHRGWFITFTTPDAAKRAGRVLSIGSRTLANRSVGVSVHPAPTPEDAQTALPAGVGKGRDEGREWGREDLVNEAEKVIVAELRALLEKDVMERLVGVQIRRMVAEERGRREERERERDKARTEAEVEAEAERGERALEVGYEKGDLERRGLKGLSFKKRKQKEAAAVAAAAAAVAPAADRRPEAGPEPEAEPWPEPEPEAEVELEPELARALDEMEVVKEPVVAVTAAEDVLDTEEYEKLPDVDRPRKRRKQIVEKAVREEDIESEDEETPPQDQAKAVPPELETAPVLEVVESVQVKRSPSPVLAEEPPAKRVKLDDDHIKGEDVTAIIDVQVKSRKPLTKKQQDKVKDKKAPKRSKKAKVVELEEPVVEELVIPPQIDIDVPVVAEVRVSPSSAWGPSASPTPPPLAVEKAPPPKQATTLPESVLREIIEDDEDMYLMKLALSMDVSGDFVLPEAPFPPSDPDAPPPFRKHVTGSARTEGYYKISHAEKSVYVAQYALRENANEGPAASEPAPQHVVSSRSNRAHARRRAQGLEEINQLQLAVALSKGETGATDAVKFNQLQTRKKHLRFARSPIHDWGLYAMERIARGEMVIEYVGEVIRAAVADKREKAYERQGIGSSYLFRIDEDLVVDATKKGNLGRLINHSCDPNCTAKIITINGEKKIVIYAKQDIELGDEITYDYHFPFEQDKIPCLCGSAKCRGFLN
ncbi:hypothetical protein M0805_000535 [Coniferiporia weirii]|nr:hypothetical protein M0805_000535 [Coniferiporia weirii]